MSPAPHPASEPWLILSSGAGGAAENMAWDEALLEASATLGAPVLRFYRWQEPAATFGYSQRHDEVAQATALRPLIRRPTGGGLVPHDADWTYSITVPPWYDWYSLPAVQSYARAHQWVQAAFARIGVETSLAPARREVVKGQCFAGWAKDDLLRDGEKLAGAAQRRNKSGLLIQGSIQPPIEKRAARHVWEAAMMTTASVRFGAAWQVLLPNDALRQRVSELVITRYGRDDYNRRR